MMNLQSDQNDGQADEPTFNAREPAWRLFAAEFNDSRHEVSDGGERAPTYVVTPLGARLNRVLVVGVLTGNEPVGEDGSVRRAQVTDPTGVFHVYAGQYQPEALQALTELEPPAIVAVVGKARTYSPEEGVVYTSIRPEAIHAVTSQERDAWILETAEHTLERIDAVNEAAKLAEPSEQRLLDLDVRDRLAKGIPEALEHYGRVDLGGYLDLVTDALGYLMPAPPEPRMAEASAKPEQAPAAAAPSGTAANEAPDFQTADQAEPAPSAAPEPPETDDEPALEPEHVVFDLVEELDTGDGALWDDIVSQAQGQGLSEEQVEETMNLLMDQGRVYEPVLGRLRTT